MPPHCRAQKTGPETGNGWLTAIKSQYERRPCHQVPTIAQSPASVRSACVVLRSELRTIRSTAELGSITTLRCYRTSATHPAGGCSFYMFMCCYAFLKCVSTTNACVCESLHRHDRNPALCGTSCRAAGRRT